MGRKINLKKIIYVVVCFTMFFQQIGFAQIVGELNIAGHLSSMHTIPIDKFRPLHLRYFSYDLASDNFKFLFDKGDLKALAEAKFKEQSSQLLKYFLIGITLPDSKFWVNLRPDSEDQIIEPELAQTDLGKVLLEADLQLKKDTAQMTSPQTPEGREYWNKLYKKAEELYGYENVTIPTLTRPWIVPGEIIVRETQDSAFIYKSSLKVMLEQDYLEVTKSPSHQVTSAYSFKDARSKALNEYSSQLIRELIIPKLTKEVNTSKKYAALRQVFYSLILSRWFKARFAGKRGLSPSPRDSLRSQGTVPFYTSLINSKNLNGLTSKESWSKTNYFKEYQKSFADGEYNIKEPVYTPTGQVIRSYFSGGINVDGQTLPAQNLLGFGGDNSVSLAANPNLIPAVSDSRPIADNILPSIREGNIDTGSSVSGMQGQNDSAGSPMTEELPFSPSKSFFERFDAAQGVQVEVIYSDNRPVRRTGTLSVDARKGTVSLVLKDTIEWEPENKQPQPMQYTWGVGQAWPADAVLPGRIFTVDENGGVYSLKVSQERIGNISRQFASTLKLTWHLPVNTAAAASSAMRSASSPVINTDEAVKIIKELILQPDQSEQIKGVLRDKQVTVEKNELTFSSPYEFATWLSVEPTTRELKEALVILDKPSDAGENPSAAGSPIKLSEQTVRTWTDFSELKDRERVNISTLDGKPLVEVYYYKTYYGKTPDRVVGSENYEIRMVNDAGKSIVFFLMKWRDQASLSISMEGVKKNEIWGRDVVKVVEETITALAFRVFDREKKVEMIVSPEWLKLWQDCKDKGEIPDTKIKTRSGYTIELGSFASSGLRSAGSPVVPQNIIQKLLRNARVTEGEITIQYELPAMHFMSGSKRQVGEQEELSSESRVRSALKILIGDIEGLNTRRVRSGGVEAMPPFFRGVATPLTLTFYVYYNDSKKNNKKGLEALLAALRENYKSYQESLLNSTDSSEPGRSASPAVTPGGIDLRVMNIVTQPLLASSSLRLAPQEIVRLAKIDLDEQFQQIKGMLMARTVPVDSLKDYVVACKLNGNWEAHGSSASSCLVETCRLLEDNVMDTPPAVKEALVIADAENIG